MTSYGYRHCMKRNTSLENALNQAQYRSMCLWPRQPQMRQLARRRAEANELLAVRHNLFARPQYWQSLDYRERIMHILRATSARHPSWILCWISAAAVWGLNDTYRMHDSVHIAVTTANSSRNRKHLRFHYIPNPDAVTRKGIRVTGLLQTIFDCARSLPFPQALAICDAAMRLYSLNADTLMNHVIQQGRRAGIERARFTLSRANPLSESGGESICRAWLILWGYARPQLQQRFVDPVTGQERRVDFAWNLDNGLIIVLEFDGREKYVNADMLGEQNSVDAVLEEKRRESNLQLSNRIIFVRTWYDEVIRQPHLVQRKLDLAGVPRSRPPKLPHSPYTDI